MESKQKSSGPEKTQSLKCEAPSAAPYPDSAQTDFGQFVAGFVFGVNNIPDNLLHHGDVMVQ